MSSRAFVCIYAQSEPSRLLLPCLIYKRAPMSLPLIAFFLFRSFLVWVSDHQDQLSFLGKTRPCGSTAAFAHNYGHPNSGFVGCCAQS